MEVRRDQDSTLPTRKRIMRALLPIAFYLRGTTDEDHGLDEEVIICDAFRKLERRHGLQHGVLAAVRGLQRVPEWEIRCLTEAFKGVGVLRGVDVMALGPLPADPVMQSVVRWLDWRLASARIDEEGGVPLLEAVAAEMGFPMRGDDLLSLGRGVATGCEQRLVRRLYDAAIAAGFAVDIAPSNDGWQAQEVDWAQVVGGLEKRFGMSDRRLSAALVKLGGEQCAESTVGDWRLGHCQPKSEKIRDLLWRLWTQKTAMPEDANHSRPAGGKPTNVVAFTLRANRPADDSALDVVLSKPLDPNTLLASESGFERYCGQLLQTASQLVAANKTDLTAEGAIGRIIDVAITKTPREQLRRGLKQSLVPQIGMAMQLLLDQQERQAAELLEDTAALG